MIHYEENLQLQFFVGFLFLNLRNSVFIYIWNVASYDSDLSGVSRGLPDLLMTGMVFYVLYRLHQSISCTHVI